MSSYKTTLFQIPNLSHEINSHQKTFATMWKKVSYFYSTYSTRQGGYGWCYLTNERWQPSSPIFKILTMSLSTVTPLSNKLYRSTTKKKIFKSFGGLPFQPKNKFYYSWKFSLISCNFVFICCYNTSGVIQGGLSHRLSPYYASVQRCQLSRDFFSGDNFIKNLNKTNIIIHFLYKIRVV